MSQDPPSTAERRARPAIGPAAPWSGPCRSGCSASAGSPSGTHCTGTPPRTSPVTGREHAGTPRRPNRPTTTWPSSSAGSSSPPDFAVHALSRPPRKKPEPSSPPGQQQALDQQKLRTRAQGVGAENRVTTPDRRFRRQPTSQSRLAGRPAGSSAVARRLAALT